MVTDEVQHVVRQAWAAITRAPSILDRITGASAMPVWAAVDMVQDVTGDRAEAITQLIYVAAAEIDAARPSEPEPDSLPRLYAGEVAGNLRCLQTNLATASVRRIRHIIAAGFPLRDDLRRVEDYRVWAIRAEFVCRWCDELAALWPKPSEENSDE